MADFEVAVKVDDARLRALSASLVSSLRDVVRVAAFGVEGRGKQRSPIDTGATMNSIYVSIAGGASTYSAAASAARSKRPGVVLAPEVRPTGLAASIGPSTSYALALELGGHGRPARPFMVPALEEERGPFIAAVERVVSRG